MNDSFYTKDIYVERKRIMEIIAERAKEILGDLAYDSYKNIVRSICESEYDYILLVDRKGAAIFRAFLRILKKVDGFGAEKIKPTIISTRVDGSYFFNEDDKILIFDDVLGTGRNIKRITENLRRRKIKNIEFCALAYSEKHLIESNEKKQAAIIELDSRGKPSINFCSKSINLEGNVSASSFLDPIPLFFNYVDDGNNSFLIKDGSYNGNYFLSEKDALTLSERLNRVVHFSLTPYSAYMVHAHFLSELRSQNTVFTYREPKSDSQYFSLPLDIAACDGENVIVEMFYREECDYSSENGYFIGTRVFVNCITQEYLVSPRLFLPSLKKSQILEICNLLGFSGTTFALLEDRGEYGFAFGDSHELFLSEEMMYESATRRVVAVLSAVYGIDFLLKMFVTEQGVKLGDSINMGCKESCEVYDEFILTPFAKSLARYFCADDFSADKNKCSEEMKKFLAKACIAVKENKNGIFDFNNTQKYPPVENLLAEYTSFRQLVNRKRLVEQIADKLFLLLEEDEITSFKHIDLNIRNRGSDRIDTERTVREIFCDTTDFLYEIDKNMYQYKLPPVPTIELLKKVHDKCEGSISYPHLVTAFDSCSEDGSVSLCYYGEVRFDQKYRVASNDYQSDKYLLKDLEEICGNIENVDVLVSCYFQHGELSVIEWCKRFSGTFLFTLSKAANEMELYISGEHSQMNKSDIDEFRKQNYDNGFMYLFAKAIEAQNKEVITNSNHYSDWINKPQPVFTVWNHSSIKDSATIRQKRDFVLAELLDIWRSYLKAKFKWNYAVGSFVDYHTERSNFI
jgi:hypothetical protein